MCCLFLQEHTIFKFKSSSGVQSLVSRYMSSIKMFLCFVAVWGFCPNVGHFSQRCDNERSVMQMKRCLKPDPGGWWLVQHWLKPFSVKMIPKDLFCLHSYKNEFPKKHLGKKRGHSEFQTQEWYTSGFFCKIPIKDLNIFEQTVIGIVLKILSVFFFYLWFKIYYKQGWHCLWSGYMIILVLLKP